MRWHKTSDYSIASGDYAVSRATVLDCETGELADRFSAWFGPDLLDPPGAAPCAPGIPAVPGHKPRKTSKPAALLGIRDTAEAAKALCQAHAAVHPVEQAA